MKSFTVKLIFAAAFFICGYFSANFKEPSDSGAHNWKYSAASNSVLPENAGQADKNHPGEIAATQHITPQLEKDKSRDSIRIPKKMAALFLEDSFDTDRNCLSEETIATLDLSKEQSEDVGKILASYIMELGSLEAKHAELRKNEQGEYYSINPLPESDELKQRFTSDILKSLSPDGEKAKIVADVIMNTKALSDFGSYRKEVYITDRIITGQKYTSVEVRRWLRDDPSSPVSRSYTISPSSKFVHARYPFLK